MPLQNLMLHGETRSFTISRAFSKDFSLGLKNIHLRLPDDDDYHNAQKRNFPPPTVPFDGFNVEAREQGFDRERDTKKAWLFMSPNLAHWNFIDMAGYDGEPIKYQHFDFVTNPNPNVPEAITDVASPLREEIRSKRREVREDMNRQAMAKRPKATRGSPPPVQTGGEKVKGGYREYAEFRQCGPSLVSSEVR